MKTYSNIERVYYKYVWDATPNATIQGNPTYNNGVYSNFSSSNYLRMKSSLKPVSGIELQIKFKITGLGSGQQGLLSNTSVSASSGSTGILIRHTSTGTIHVLAGSGWGIFSNSFSVTTNVPIWLRYVWNGSVHKIQISYDGETFTDKLTKNSTSSIGTVTYMFGYHNGGSGFAGEIDFRECWVKINDDLSWIGFNQYTVRSTSSDYDFYKDSRVYKSCLHNIRKYYKRYYRTNGTISAPLGLSGYLGHVDGWEVSSEGFNLNGVFEGTAYNRITQNDCYIHLKRDLPFTVSTFNVRDGGQEGTSSCFGWFDVYTVDDDDNETFIVRGTGYAERRWTNVSVDCGNVQTKHLKVQIHGNANNNSSAMTLIGLTGTYDYWEYNDATPEDYNYYVDIQNPLALK